MTTLVNFIANSRNCVILEIDVEDEFDDVELDEATLFAVSGGRGRRGSGC